MGMLLVCNREDPAEEQRCGDYLGVMRVDTGDKGNRSLDSALI